MWKLGWIINCISTSRASDENRITNNSRKGKKAWVNDLAILTFWLHFRKIRNKILCQVFVFPKEKMSQHFTPGRVTLCLASLWRSLMASDPYSLALPQPQSAFLTLLSSFLLHHCVQSLVPTDRSHSHWAISFFMLFKFWDTNNSSCYY